jgi:hypothetical protein
MMTLQLTRGVRRVGLSSEIGIIDVVHSGHQAHETSNRAKNMPVPWKTVIEDLYE